VARSWIRAQNRLPGGSGLNARVGYGVNATTVSDLMIAIALWTAAGAIVLAAAMMLQVGLLRLRLNARLRHEAKFLARWRPLLLDCVDTMPAHLPTVKEPDWFAFLALWNHFQESLRGAARHRLKAVALRLRMDVAARALLRRGSTREKLMAILTLGHLGDHESWRLLVKIARGPHALLSLVAARALLLTDDARAMQALLPQLASRADWPVTRLEVLLSEAEPLVVARALASAAEIAPKASLPRLVALMDAGDADEIRPIIARLVEHSSETEVLIACLKSRHLPADRTPLLKLLHHEAWQVRTQAARVMGRIGSRGDEAVLAPLLSDPVWWVRYRAAQALARLPSLSREDLWQFRGRLTDPFACDILDQVIAEGHAR
jgi:HEAT repeat protein